MAGPDCASGASARCSRARRSKSSSSAYAVVVTSPAMAIPGSGAERRVHALNEFTFARGFDQVVTRALAQPPDAVRFHALRTENDDRNGRGGRVLAQAARRLEAVH